MNKPTIRTNDDLKLFLYKNYMQQIENFLGDAKSAKKFLSCVMASVQKTPKLLECDSLSLVNSFITMAQLGLMPSEVSGEAYVLPYKGKAQFQLGYQGLITLFYRAGGTSIRAEIVRENDDFQYENGKITHKINIMHSNNKRGAAVGAYAIAEVNGTEISKAMNRDDIIEFGKSFSKSYSSEYSPWNEKNDPELWMWKKTVLKQLGKMLPKNETIHLAIAEDNKDSVISERIESSQVDVESLKIGAHEVKEEEVGNEANDEEIISQCETCAKILTKDEDAYSNEKYSKPLCRTCQKEYAKA